MMQWCRHSLRRVGEGGGAAAVAHAVAARHGSPDEHANDERQSRWTCLHFAPAADVAHKRRRVIRVIRVRFGLHQERPPLHQNKNAMINLTNSQSRADYQSSRQNAGLVNELYHLICQHACFQSPTCDHACTHNFFEIHSDINSLLINRAKRSERNKRGEKSIERGCMTR